MHKCLRVTSLKFESHSTYKMDFTSLSQLLTKRGLEVFSRLTNMSGSQQNQQPPNVEAKGRLRGIYSPFEKLAVDEYRRQQLLSQQRM
jgi:hypothetical protein